ncbi:hypothetical protein ABWK22_02115 [Gottfriedia acidiceleris]|uniref:hypothetical protein n=1 Tax=Gottfriedia acidiceleris TaxID=371036 RepID=UPI003395702A
MKKLLGLCLVLMISVLGACSDKSKDAPAYIKESFKYYETMSKVTDATEDGTNVQVAFDKYKLDEGKVKDFFTAIENDSNASEKELAVANNIHIMLTKLQTLYIADYNASMGGDPVDVEQFVHDLQVPRYELEKVYKKYDLEYKK